MRPSYLDKPVELLTWEDLPQSRHERGSALVTLALREMPYSEYLRTNHWKKVRWEALCRCGFKCICGKRATEVHHLSYENRGCEEAGDTVGLCGECHDRWHKTWQHRSRAALEMEAI
jgi:hypothetical protein